MLDEATTSYLGQLASTGTRPLYEMPLASARASMEELISTYGGGPKMARVDETDVEGASGSFRVRTLVPCTRPSAILVYYHGGGWVVGSVDQVDTLGRRLAARTDCAVVLVDYRQAPEYRYPTAVEDAWAALCWASDHGRDIAGAGVPLVVAGDSAGGNLAAVVAQRAVQRHGPRIALQVLIYPVTDCEFDRGSYIDPDNQLALDRASMVWYWDTYVPNVAARHEPDASPGRAVDLSGLPPAVLVTAEHDVLRDEGEAYAQRLRDAGVPVRHRRFVGQMHGFFTMLNILPGSDAGMDYVVGAVLDAVGSSAPTSRHTPTWPPFAARTAGTAQENHDV